MQSAADIASRLMDNAPAAAEESAPFDLMAYLRRKCDRANAETGKLGGVNCPDCLNRGYIMRVVDGPFGPCEALEECRCMQARRSLERVAASGLGPALRACRFDTFEAREPWQAAALETAKRYAHEAGDAWLFVGGQVGSGKTHLCTAVCRRLILRMPVLYAIWPEELQALKATRFDAGEYGPRMRRLMDIDLLYLDDFLKACRGQAPTATDVQIAHELINHRYAARKKTIISSERTLEEIEAIDEATGGRVRERCGGYVLRIERGRGKDWRMKEE